MCAYVSACVRMHIYVNQCMYDYSVIKKDTHVHFNSGHTVVYIITDIILNQTLGLVMTYVMTP